MNTTLVLSAIVVMCFFPRNPFEPYWPLTLFASLGLIWPPVLRHKIFWLAITGIAFAYVIADCFQYSRTFLIAYWSLAITLALHAHAPCEQEQIIRKNAQYLVAFTMVIAGLSKLASKEFMDGSFFQSWMLLMPHNLDFTRTFLGFSRADYSQNQAILHDVMNSDVMVSRRLVFSAYDPIILQTMSRWFSVAAAFGELIIGVLFLMPAPSIIFALRHALLIFFLLSCYFVVPVFTFAAILIVLGYAQCESHEKWLKRIYCSLIPVIALYTIMPKFGGWWKLRLVLASLW